MEAVTACLPVVAVLLQVNQVIFDLLLIVDLIVEIAQVVFVGGNCEVLFLHGLAQHGGIEHGVGGPFGVAIVLFAEASKEVGGAIKVGARLVD